MWFHFRGDCMWSSINRAEFAEKGEERNLPPPPISQDAWPSVLVGPASPEIIFPHVEMECRKGYGGTDGSSADGCLKPTLYLEFLEFSKLPDTEKNFLQGLFCFTGIHF